MNNKTLVFSPLTGSKLTGHLILDDVFWLNYFLSQGVSADIITSTYSKDNLLKVFPDHRGKIDSFAPKFDDDFAGRFKLIRKLLSTKTISNTLVVIQGFEELSIFLFLLKNIGRKNKYVLVPTNNIGKGRIESKGTVLSFLLKRIFSMVDVILCHTKYEISIINQLIGYHDNDKLQVVKYHQAINREKVVTPANKRPVISFFGPAKHDKPIKPLVDLVQADKQALFDYRIYNPGDYESELLATITKRENVIVVSKWMDNNEYETAVCNSTYILLSQNKYYEGKLSGNLCDCISYSIPFISLDISPVNEYIEQYGQLGFVFDFDQPQWAAELFSQSPLEQINTHIEAMKRMRADYTEQCLIAELNDKLP